MDVGDIYLAPDGTIAMVTTLRTDGMVEIGGTWVEVDPDTGHPSGWIPLDPPTLGGAG